MLFTDTPYFNEFCDLAEEKGFTVSLRELHGLLVMDVEAPGIGTVARWPIFNGSIDKTALYAMRCWQEVDGEHE